MKHVDNFIWDEYSPEPNARYAAWFFMLHRLPAANQMAWQAQIAEYRLFCTYAGARYRVTGASRLGDVWLHSDFKVDVGYEQRVDLADCSDWSPRP